MTWRTQPIFGHLRGTAVATDGTPLTGTVVHLVEPSSGIVMRTATTDGTGWFGFVDLPVGSYRVTTESPRVSGGVLGQGTVVAGRLPPPRPAAPPTAPPPTPPPPPRPPSRHAHRPAPI